MSPNNVAYDYAEEDCDVSDRGALAEFRRKRIEWIAWLADGDNSIWRQINTMIWSDRLYWMINESRRISREQGGDFATRSGWLGEVFDKGYFATQLLALRKLTDPPSNNPKRQVVSLRRLLDDLRAHRHLFTRENYVCLDGLRFDPEEARRSYWATAPEIGAHYGKSGGPLDDGMSERMHRSFDALTDATTQSRDRFECLREDVFDDLDGRLKAAPLDEARAIANKRVAHAPDAASIPIQGLPALTFKELWQCQQALCEVASFTTVFIVQGSMHAVVPEPPLDMFNHWDKPFMPSVAKEELMELWEETSKERNVWGNENVSAMLEEIRNKRNTDVP